MQSNYQAMPIKSGYLLLAGTAKPTSTALGLREFGYLLKIGLNKRCDDHLSNPVAALNSEGFRAVINQYYADFAAVIGVNSAGGVEYGNAMLQGQAGAGAYLCLIIIR